MFLKKKIDVIVKDGTSSLIIISTCNNKFAGRINCTVYKEQKKIAIEDIWCKKNNKGYGSLMMRELIEYAKQHGIKYIDGWLSGVDANHLERLYHFYHKFGFIITPNEDGIRIADIKLII